MTSPWLTAGYLRTCSRLALHRDSHLPPASQARVPFLPVCLVSHLLSEEKTCPTTRQPASHQPAVYRVHRWPRDGEDTCMELINVAHYNPAPGLGGEAFWPAGDSSSQRTRKPSSPKHLLAGCRARCLASCSISFRSPPSL